MLVIVCQVPNLKNMVGEVEHAIQAAFGESSNLYEVSHYADETSICPDEAQYTSKWIVVLSEESS